MGALHFSRNRARKEGKTNARIDGERGGSGGERASERERSDMLIQSGCVYYPMGVLCATTRI